jgi:hypothetical protein
LFQAVDFVGELDEVEKNEVLDMDPVHKVFLNWLVSEGCNSHA